MGGSTGMTGTGVGTEIVLVGADNGVVVLTSDTPLRRLNYFDGKFLRAQDMQAEQDYLRFLVQLSNRAGGSGVLHGYDTTLAQGGAAVTVGQGLAVDPKGRILLMAITKTMLLDDLIAATAKAQKSLPASAVGSADFGDCVVVSEPTATTSGQSCDLYLLTVGFLEALCGEEDVFGQICDDACVQGKDRRWRMEGVLFRALPLTLKTALRVSSAVAVNPNQLCNRVASAYFEDERLRIASLVNGTSIKNSDAWCLGAQAEIGDAVPLAVFSRSGGATKFLDAWTARRERIEPPPRRYWAWRFSMRPWNVFLAQVLQFQCQLRGILAGQVDGGAASDPCVPHTKAIGKATELLGQLETWVTKMTTTLTPKKIEALEIKPFEVAAISGLKNELGKLTVPGALASTRILVDRGMSDIPSTGYFPVDNSGKLTVNEQVRALMGPGVDLRYCIVTPDYVPHAFEMRQHMDRISLLDGIEDPTNKPKVDILVPGGRIVENKTAGGGIPFQMVGTAPTLFREPVQGAANAARRSGSGGTFTLAGTSPAPTLEAIIAAAKEFVKASATAPQPASPGFTAISSDHLGFATKAASDSYRILRDLSGEALHLTPLYDLSGAGAANLIAAVESSVAIDADPFLLDVSDSTALRLDLLLGLKGQKGSLVHLTAGGTMYFTKKDSVQGIDYAIGTISGHFAVSGAGGTSPGSNVVWKYQLVRRATTGGTREITGALKADGLPFILFSYQWNSSPLKGTLKVYKFGETPGFAMDAKLSAFTEGLGVGAIGITVPAQAAPFLEIDLKQDPAVMDATESHHVLAESALTILAAMLPNGADWQKATEAALFPKPEGGADNITVLGDRDWVLFARRRLDTCVDEVVTAKRPNRRYHVYVHEAKSTEDAKSWVGILLKEDASDVRDLRFVGLVEFDGATDDPVDPAGLRKELDPVKGDALRYDVVASDYGDGVSEEGRRRSRFEQCVNQVADVTQATPFDLETLPAWFRGRIDGGESVHGVVMLVAVPQVAVANVYAMQRALAGYVLFKQPGSDEVRDPVDLTPVKDEARKSMLLGSVTFRAGKPNETELKTVAGKWKDAGYDLAYLVTVTAKAVDDGAAETEKNAILMAVGKGPATVVRKTHASAGFDDQPNVNAMVFLVAGDRRTPVVTGTVVLVKAEGAAEVKQLLDEGKVNEVLTRLKDFIEVVPSAEYHADTATITNPETIREAWKGAAGKAKPGGVMTFVAGDDAGVTKEIRAQAKSVGAALTPGAAAPSVTVAAATDAPAAPAGAAPALYHFVLPK